MRPFWKIKSLYNCKSRSIKKRWLYGLASVTFFGSGGSLLLFLPSSNYNEVKVKRCLELLNKIFPPVSPISAVIDWEEWLTSDFQSGPSVDHAQWTKEIMHTWVCSFPYKKFKTDNPWVLLELTNSSHFWVRQISVAALAISKLEAYKIRNIAQACQPRTSVSLARYPHASNLFFLPPPRLYNFEHTILKELRSQLTQLPTPSSGSAISHFKAIALDKEVVFQDHLSLDLEGPLYTIPGEKEKKEENILMFCLQAVLEYTAEREYSVQFIENHGLAVLQRLVEERSDLWVNIYVASILANLSMYNSLLEDLVRTGWLYMLRQWASNDNATLSLLALTALANLDRDSIDSSLYQDTILIHPTKKNCPPAKVDIIFVHGLNGGAVRTWRQQDGSAEKVSQCWPRDWLAIDCPNIRILSFGYTSCLHQWGDDCPVEQDKRTLEGRGQDLIKKLKQAEVGSRPIIWVGHSMGGLLIKEILALSEDNSESSELRTKTEGIIMYSVPHHGSAIVDAMMYAKYLIFPSVELQELLTSSPKLTKLHDKFLSIVSSKSVPLLSFGETVKTDFGNKLLKIMIVPPESSDPGVGQYINLPVNHINSCKPSSESDIIYQSSVLFIKNILDHLHI